MNKEYLKAAPDFFDRHFPDEAFRMNMREDFQNLPPEARAMIEDIFTRANYSSIGDSVERIRESKQQEFLELLINYFKNLYKNPNFKSGKNTFNRERVDNELFRELAKMQITLDKVAFKPVEDVDAAAKDLQSHFQSPTSK